MTHYRVVITNTAQADLENIKAFISKDNVEAAKKYLEKIYDRLELLDTFPFQGKPICNSFFHYVKAYYLVCLNHVAIYQVDEKNKSVHVLTIRSHFQDWKNIVNKDLLNHQTTLIEDDFIRIVKLDTSMYYDIYRNSLDEDNRRFVPDEVFETLEEASEVVDYLINCYQDENGPFVYAIFKKENNINIGYVQLSKVKEGYEIGYHVAKLYTGNGYATRAVSLFLNFISENSNIREIFGIALSKNKASLRVLEKCGFEPIFEGTGLYQGKRRKIIKTIKYL